MLLRHFLSLCLLFAVVATPARAADEIRIGTGNGAISQAAMSVLREAYRRIGVTVTTVNTTPEEGLRQANRGELDGTPARVAGLESRFPNLLRVPVAVVEVDAMVFGNRMPLVVNGWDSLRPYRVGVLKGVQYASEGTRGMQVDTFGDNAQLFAKLENESIDFAVSTRIEGVLMMRELGTRHVTMLEPPLSKIVLYHYLNAGHRDLLPKLTASLKAMEKEGRMTYILRQTLAAMLAQARDKRKQGSAQ